MRLAVWSPLPPSSSGIADYVAETLPALARHFELEAVVEDPAAVDPTLARHASLRAAHESIEADLDLYHVGNSPPHGYVYRRAQTHPGVSVLHEWNLHQLVLSETVERGDTASYLLEMRRAYGETGRFVGTQIARGLGGAMLPALYPLHDRVLEASLAVVGLSDYVRERAGQRLPGRPVIRLPHHLSLPIDPPPTRDEARRLLGWPVDAPIVVAPGLATATKRLDVVIQTIATLRERHPGLRLVIAGGEEAGMDVRAWAEHEGVGDAVTVSGRLGLIDFEHHIVAADVIVALRFPTYGEMSGALVRALGVGRPALVTAGSPAALEFPEGVVVPVDPGPREAAELAALLDRLLGDAAMRESIGRFAREHVRAHHDLDHAVEVLAEFLRTVHDQKPQLQSALQQDHAEEDTLLGFLMEEVRWAARDLGLAGAQLGLEPVLRDLAGDVR